MAYETWNYPVETKPQVSTTLKTKTSRFGDNYVQKAGYGLNGKSSNITVVVDNDETVVKEARDFLDRHGGHIPFLWMVPGRTTPQYFTCGSYGESPHLADQNRLTATFEEYFIP